jgi:ABC-type lipoprotein export system ATPase subunit
MNILENLNKEGRTIILVTHDMHVALHADRIVTIKDGEILSDKKVSKSERVHSEAIKD